MIHSSSYEISTREFFSIIKEEVEQTESLDVTKVIDKLRNNIFNHLDGDINLDYYNIQACLSETQQGIIQVVKTDNVSIKLRQVLHDYILGINTENFIEHIIIHFIIHPSISLTEVATSLELIYDTAHEEADVCFCISYRNLSKINQIEINSFIFYKDLSLSKPLY